MVSEETPLLNGKHDAIYERFSAEKKKILVFIVSLGALVTFFTTGTFIPSLPQMAQEFGCTDEVISYSVSISILSAAIGSLAASRYSAFYGRRAVYIWWFPLMIIGSFGVASARTVTQLMVWRAVQAMGASPGTSVGAGVIGDIYKLEERGTALGIYFCAGLVGFAFSPTIAGLTAYYWSWRAIHILIGSFAIVSVICIALFCPETMHPGTKGVDKYKKLGLDLPTWRPVILNPVAQLGMLRSPNIMAAALISYATMLVDYSLMVPLPYTLSQRYGIKNEALLGMCFLPLGLGKAVGAPIAGRISDRIVTIYKKKRGFWYPEDRLRASLFSLYLPLTVFGAGLVTRYIPGVPGLVLNLVLLFLTGIGCDVALTPCSAYIVDVLHSKSAEATATVGAFRSLTLTISTAMLLPMVNTYGLLFTNSILAIVFSASLGLTIFTIAYGDSMRAWVDIGFSTAEDN